MKRTLMMLIIATSWAILPVQAEEGLIEQLTSKLGVSQKQAEGGSGAIFKYLKENVSGDDFGKIAEAVPGVDKYMAAAPKADALGGLIGGALGDSGAGGLGSLAALSKPFSKMGMDEGMVAKFMPIIVEYVKSKGSDYIYGLMGKALLGKEQKSGGLISKLTGELGVTPDQAALGAGAIFGYVKDNVSEKEFTAVADAVPAMKDLLGSQEKKPESKGLSGLSSSLGGIAEKIQKPDVLGTDVNKGLPGSKAEEEPGYKDTLKEKFGKLGLDEDLVEKYLPVILGWVKSQGKDYASGLLENLFTKKE